MNGLNSMNVIRCPQRVNAIELSIILSGPHLKYWKKRYKLIPSVRITKRVGKNVIFKKSTDIHETHLISLYFSSVSISFMHH